MKIKNIRTGKITEIDEMEMIFHKNLLNRGIEEIVNDQVKEEKAPEETKELKAKVRTKTVK